MKTMRQKILKVKKVLRFEWILCGAAMMISCISKVAEAFGRKFVHIFNIHRTRIGFN